MMEEININRPFKTNKMADTKILSLIPEALREDLINEVVELLKQRSEKEKKDKGKPVTGKELEAALANLKI